MDFREIERKVIKWGKDRDLYTQSCAENQVEKLYEELEELNDALYVSDEVSVYDAIGDMLVVLTHIAHLSNITLTRCYRLAYEEIKDRKGKMINGKFVKE